jgi:hypothetical protein
MSVAARAGRLDIIKQLKPQNYPNVLATLFADVWLDNSQPLIDYLMKIGAPLNTKPNGSSDLLGHLLWRLSWGPRGVFGYSSSDDIIKTLETVKRICRLGAKWIPDPEETTRNIRDRFRKMEPRHLLELFRIFKDTGATSIELLDSVLASPALRKSLGAHLRAIENILHPPAPKPADTPPAKQAQKAENLNEREPPTVAELRTNAKTLLLDTVRQEPNPHFTTQSVLSSLDNKSLKRRLGMRKEDDRDVQAIVVAATEQLNRRLESFRFELEWWGRANCRLVATLNKDAEWPEAQREAWSYAKSVNDALLTDASLKLRDLISSGEIGSDWNSERSITWKMGLRGRERCLAAYLFEIAAKTDVPVEWDMEGERYGEQRYRIHIAEHSVSQHETHKAINPVINIQFDNVRKNDHDTVRQLLYDELLKASPTGNAPFYLIFVSSRRDLRKCFPRFNSTRGDHLAEFFHDLPLNETLTIAFDFREDATSWHFAVCPKPDWTHVLNAIREEMSRPSLSEQYGLSGDAAKLLSWVQSLPRKRFTGKWTPIVDDACDRWIGIKCPWSDENVSAYLQMLLDEINERTEYDLTLQPWIDCGRTKSRIRVARKHSDIEDLIKQVQLLALRNGSAPAATDVRQYLKQLISGSVPI